MLVVMVIMVDARGMLESFGAGTEVSRAYRQM
jgi:hypothetical protein